MSIPHPHQLHATNDIIYIKLNNNNSKGRGGIIIEKAMSSYNKCVS